jgi:hypothetical protein
MSHALIDFLARLATDPQFYFDFQRNPDLVMQEARLSATEVAAFKSGKAGELAALLGQQGPSPTGQSGPGISPPVAAGVAGSAAYSIAWVPVVVYFPVVVLPVPGLGYAPCPPVSVPVAPPQFPLSLALAQFPTVPQFPLSLALAQFPPPPKEYEPTAPPAPYRALAQSTGAGTSGKPAAPYGVTHPASPASGAPPAGTEPGPPPSVPPESK